MNVKTLILLHNNNSSGKIGQKDIELGCIHFLPPYLQHLPAIWKVDDKNLPEIFELQTNKLRLLLQLSIQPKYTPSLHFKRSVLFSRAGAHKHLPKFPIPLTQILASPCERPFLLNRPPDCQPRLQSETSDVFLPFFNYFDILHAR